MSLSLTWQALPPFLLRPLMDSAISLAEACELFDLILQLRPNERLPLPKHLHPAADRLSLWALDLKGCPVH